MSDNQTNKVLTIVLAILLVGLAGALVYLNGVPYPGDRFSEFYILDAQGQAENYPTNLKPGEDARVILVIENREQKTVDYSIEITVDGKVQERIEGISLPHEGKWQKVIALTPPAMGDTQKVEFFLYLSGESTPYRGPLSLLVSTG